MDGGYTQADVTQLARMFTGWTFYPGERRTGEFVFDAARHDSADKQWLGLTIPAQGVQEGEKALDVLAAHPATAQRVAYQLAQYFVADEPPSSLVKQLASTFTSSKGDLRVVMAALFNSKEFRDPRYFGKKFKTPYQYVISSVRASGLPLSNTLPLSQALKQLGQPLYGCLTPDGYKNTAAAWLNPDGLSARIQFAGALAGGKLPLDAPLIDTLKATDRASMPAAEFANDRALNASQLVATLRGSIKPETLNKIDSSPIPLRATLLLGSPDFMYH